MRLVQAELRPRLVGVTGPTYEQRRWDSVCAGDVPLVVAARVVLGILINLGHIVTTRYADLGWSRTLE